MFGGKRTFFVSLPQIKKQRPEVIEDIFFFFFANGNFLPSELDLIAGLMINGRLERIR
jgi:hypothetical protein